MSGLARRRNGARSQPPGAVGETVLKPKPPRRDGDGTCQPGSMAASGDPGRGRHPQRRFERRQVLPGTRAPGAVGIVPEPAGSCSVGTISCRVSRIVGGEPPGSSATGHKTAVPTRSSTAFGATRSWKSASSAGACSPDITALSRPWLTAGVDVVVEEVMITEAEWLDWYDAPRGLQVRWVGVRCDAEVAEARERSRKDRYRGLARGTSGVVHGHPRDDVEIDTDHGPPDQLAIEVDVRLAESGLRGG